MASRKAAAHRPRGRGRCVTWRSSRTNPTVVPPRARVVERGPVPRVHAVLQALAHAAVAFDTCDPAVVDRPSGHLQRGDPAARRAHAHVVHGGESEGIERLRCGGRAQVLKPTRRATTTSLATARRGSSPTSVACRHWRLAPACAAWVVKRSCDSCAGATSTRQLLVARPDTAHRERARRGTVVVRWRRCSTRGREGCTGVPVVDAGMQLVREGWTAAPAPAWWSRRSSPNLMRIGPWLLTMAHLVDGDVAQNQLQLAVDRGNPHTNLLCVQPDRAEPEVRPPWRVHPATSTSSPASTATTSTTRHREERDRFGYPAPLVDHHEAIDQWRASRALLTSNGHLRASVEMRREAYSTAVRRGRRASRCP